MPLPDDDADGCTERTALTPTKLPMFDVGMGMPVLSSTIMLPVTTSWVYGDAIVVLVVVTAAMDCFFSPFDCTKHAFA